MDSDLHDAVCVLSDVEAEVMAVREQIRLHPPAGDEDGLRMDVCVKALDDTRAAFRHRPEDMTLGLLLPRGPRAAAGDAAFCCLALLGAAAALSAG